MRVLTVHKSGGQYKPAHVRWMRDQLKHYNFYVLSDVVYPDVNKINLEHGLPGWWSKMELFRPDIERGFLYVDLDSVIVQGEDIKTLHELKRDKLTMWKDHHRKKEYNTSIMWVEGAECDRIWREFHNNKEEIMANYRDDQGFISEVLGDVESLYDNTDIQSYKVHRLDTHEPKAPVVTFHGKPKPWDVKKDWIPECD